MVHIVAPSNVSFLPVSPYGAVKAVEYPLSHDEKACQHQKEPVFRRHHVAAQHQQGADEAQVREHLRADERGDPSLQLLDD